MKTIGFIGAGNMAGAILANVLQGGLLSADQVAIYDINKEKCDRYARDGHPVFDSVPELVAACSSVVLAVKPQTFPDILPQVKQAMTADKLLVSIAAGISASYIQDSIGFPCKLVLVMPNTPLMGGVGATAVSRIEPTSTLEFLAIKSLFAASGIVEEVPADKMNAAMAVHSTTPAFMYLFAQTLVESAVQAGVDRAVAGRLCSQMLVGSAWMMEHSGKTYQQLIDMVCSPGGTTLAGLSALEKGGFTTAVQQAFAASVRRAEELSL